MHNEYRKLVAERDLLNAKLRMGITGGLADRIAQLNMLTGPSLVLPDGTEYAGKLQHDENGDPVVVVATCGACGFQWNDEMSTSLTPPPSGRCPNEYGHEPEDTVFTVVAAYHDPPSIFCTTVEAADAADAIREAWVECCDGNGWSPDEVRQEDEWSDTMVITGRVEVVG